MSFIEKAKQMLFARRDPQKNDAIKADYGRALQRNEMASEAARDALTKLKMSDTLRDITGRMK